MVLSAVVGTLSSTGQPVSAIANSSSVYLSVVELSFAGDRDRSPAGPFIELVI